MSGSSLNSCKAKICSITDISLRNSIADIFTKYLNTLSNPLNVGYTKYHLFSTFIDSITGLSVNDLTWDMFCELVQQNQTAVKEYATLLIYLLENNTYYGDYKDTLCSIIPYLKSATKNYLFIELFCYKNISKFFFFNRYSSVNRSIFFIETDCHSIRVLLEEFIANNYALVIDSYLFITHFNSSLNNSITKPSCISDFSYKTFKNQFSYFSKENNGRLLHCFFAFYCFIIEHPSGEGQHILKPTDPLSLNVLKRPNLAQELLKGHRVIRYNPFDAVPLFDKWILEVNAFEKESTKLTKDSCFLVDFSIIHHESYRQISKKLFWKSGNSNLVTKNNQCYLETHFLNEIEKLKITYNQNNNPPASFERITINEAYLYKSLIKSNSEMSVWTKNSYLTAVRKILTYASQKEFLSLDEGVIKYLGNLPVTKRNTAKSIPEDDLIKLNHILKSNCENSLLHQIYYVIFHVCLQTEMRISQIVSLKSNCIQETLKKGQYTITSSSKSSHGENFKAGISIYTKKHLDDVLLATSNCRSECLDEEMRGYLFLYKSSIKNKYHTPRKGAFTIYLKCCCEKSGIPEYTAQNLCDTHMTKVEEHRLRKNLSDVEAQLLTGHKRVDTTRNHYIMQKLESILESTYGIVIGNVNIVGQICYDTDSAVIKRKENTVSNSCGFCSIKTCDFTTNLDCLMCNHFIATVDRIPFFEAQIHRIDTLISDSITFHDKEDLMNIKRLHIMFLKELLVLKEGQIDG